MITCNAVIERLIVRSGARCASGLIPGVSVGQGRALVVGAPVHVWWSWQCSFGLGVGDEALRSYEQWQCASGIQMVGL